MGTIHDVIKKIILMNAFFKLQFNYFLLIWVWFNRSLNKKINWLQEHCLCMLCNYKKSSFEELLERYGSISIHHRKIKYSSIEMFKAFKGISPKMMKNILQFRDAMPYQSKKQTDFQIPSVHSDFSGTGGMKFLWPKLWEIFPHEIKHKGFQESNKNNGNQHHIHVGHVKLSFTDLVLFDTRFHKYFLIIS